MAEKGWDKGIVVFGMLASEATVKVATALNLLQQQDNFSYKNNVQWVDLSFDTKPFSEKKGKKSMGVNSDMWMTLSGNKGYMPALAVDGQLMLDAYSILAYLWDQFPDQSLSGDEQKQVQDLLSLNSKQTERLLQTLKHWGWAAMQGKKKNYIEFGYGKKDLSWEQDSVKVVDDFFRQLEDKLKEKKESGGLDGFFVGNKMTLADCALINWAQSFKLVIGLNVPKRYPLVWENHELMKKKAPAGSKDFYGTFPMFAKVVGVLNARNRGSGCCCLCGKGFNIENQKYWD